MTSVMDPRTGAYERELAPPSGEELASLAQSLRAGQRAWGGRSTAERAEILERFADALTAATDELTAALVADTGRRIETDQEVIAVAGMARRWARAAPALLEPERSESAVPGISLLTTSSPYPLIGVISPWNFPLLLTLIDAIPALAAGCAVLMKPSEVTPRFVGPLRRAVAKVPELAEVVGIVEGAGETGAAIVELVDAVCFTGSVATGRRVAVAAAGAFIPAFLELGGKDPAIVLGGADLDRAASALLWGSIANAGQSCLSIERIYVQRSVHDDFVTRLTAKAEQVTFARPGPGDGMLGPLIDPGQADIIAAHLDDARAHGALVRCGGRIERFDGGYWVPPTVVTGVDHSMALMREETFGPVMPVMAFETIDDAVAAANDSEYGLSAAVFGPDLEGAVALAQRLRVGAVSVNDAGLTAFVHDGEKNSRGFSGLGGSRMGLASLRRFLRKQTVMVSHATGRDPWWHTP